jgi:hypothetical protein
MNLVGMFSIDGGKTIKDLEIYSRLLLGFTWSNSKCAQIFNAKGIIENCVKMKDFSN